MLRKGAGHITDKKPQVSKFAYSFRNPQLGYRLAVLPFQSSLVPKMRGLHGLEREGFAEFGLQGRNLSGHPLIGCRKRVRGPVVPHVGE